MPSSGNDLRGLFKQMAGVRPATVLIGRVTKASPLRIQVLSDNQLQLDEDDLYLPRHLTNHRLPVSLSMGEHYTDTLTVNNALKEGEQVYLLSFQGGELYYVLDRIGG